MNYTIRDYTPADETSWLRCRVLSFLNTAFYDAVVPSKPTYESPCLELVATDAAGTVVAIMDTAIDDGVADIDTAAIHPDHQRRGLGRLLLDQTRTWARTSGATTLQAWTRDDPDALAWYRATGFTEDSHYLHVYASHYTASGEPGRAIAGPRPNLRHVTVYAHAAMPDEQRLREEFARVHVARRFAMPL